MSSAICFNLDQSNILSSGNKKSGPKKVMISEYTPYSRLLFVHFFFFWNQQKLLAICYFKNKMKQFYFSYYELVQSTWLI